MQWLGANWFWVLIAVVFVAAHLFGHGGHGGHGGGHGGHQPSSPDDEKPSTGHQH